MKHEISQIIRNPNRPCGCILGDVPCAENRQNQANHSRYTPLYPDPWSSLPNEVKQ